MYDRITEFFIDVETGSVKQSQREGLIDLLIWAMVVDGSIAFAENARFEQVLNHLHWQSPLQIRQYLGMAYARIRPAVDAGQDRDALLASITKRLATKNMRDKAYDLVEELAAIDARLSDEEQKLLELLRRAFSAVETG